MPVPGGYGYERRQQRAPSPELGVDRVQNRLHTPQHAPSWTRKTALGKGLMSVIHASVWASEAVCCLPWGSSSAKVLKKPYTPVKGWQWHFLSFLTKQLSCGSEIAAAPSPSRCATCFLLRGGTSKMPSTNS